MEQGQNLSEFLEESEFGDASNFCSGLAASPEDIFSILESLERASYSNTPREAVATGVSEAAGEESFEFPNSAYFQESESEFASFMCKKQKLANGIAGAGAATCVSQIDDGQPRVSHITVERNRRKQMNEHLAVLRSLMPCFYVKRGDQASIIGGVINYITELQQVVQSLESKRQRKNYAADVLSPRPSPLSPRMLPLSPRVHMPISPRTPQPGSPYKPGPNILHTGYLLSPSLMSPVELSPCNSSTSTIIDSVNELAASSKSSLAEVEVKFSGQNLLVKTVSHRIHGQAVKVISAMEELALEILQVNMSTVDDRIMTSFTVKIGIECQLSADELADHIQQTFSYKPCISTVC